MSAVGEGHQKPRIEPQLFLASSSPRRMELLTQLGLVFKVIEQSADERRFPEEEAAQYVCRLAKLKAESGLNLVDILDSKPVLGADTIVVCDGLVLGKPENRQQGVQMLSILSGKKHEVLTAVTLTTASKEASILSRSVVQFREIKGQEMDNYWLSGEPQDKAGGYAIQGLGALFVQSIEGSYSGIVGLPLFETAQLLTKFDIDVISGNLGK